MEAFYASKPRKRKCGFTVPSFFSLKQETFVFGTMCFQIWRVISNVFISVISFFLDSRVLQVRGIIMACAFRSAKAHSLCVPVCDVKEKCSMALGCIKFCWEGKSVCSVVDTAPCPCFRLQMLEKHKKHTISLSDELWRALHITDGRTLTRSSLIWGACATLLLLWKGFLVLAHYDPPRVSQSKWLWSCCLGGRLACHFTLSAFSYE